MRSGHSTRACQRCRQRRVKCDKTLPACARCANFGQPCPGYFLYDKFIDQRSQARERVVRQQDRTLTAQQRTSNSETSPASSSQHPPPNRLIVSSHGSIAASTSDHLSNPPSAFSIINENFDLGGSDTGDQTDEDLQYFDLDIESYYADGNNACGFFAELGDSEAFSTHTSDAAPIAFDAESGQQGRSVPRNSRLEDFEATSGKDNSESALLMRLFVEMLAPWMDLFDAEAYFTRIVPRNAAFDILLRLALKAVAAKQTARYVDTPNHSKYSKLFDLVLAEYPNDSSDQWFYRAASYYDQGISCLRSRLQQLADRSGRFDTWSTPVAMSGQAASSMLSHEFSASRSSQESVKELEQNLLSAVSMFSFYETLDECFAKPSQHISGFLALIENSNAGVTSLHSEAQFLLAYNSAGRAAFWYFVRKDMFNSYAQSTKPAFDPESYPLWVAAGLPIGVFSHQMSENRDMRFEDLLDLQVSGNIDKMIYILIWLSVKVVNMISVNDTDQTLNFGEQITTSAGEAFLQRHTQESSMVPNLEWTRIREKLTWWFEYRPEVLHAYASYTPSPASIGGKTLQKASLFTCSIGAAAMQLYHFIQILLLLNQRTSTPHRWNQETKLRMLKKSSQEIEFHSQEIWAIALEKPAFAVQRQMSHPLRLASIYLDSAEDQHIILRILTTILAETCSPIDHHTQGSGEE